MLKKGAGTLAVVLGVALLFMANYSRLRDLWAQREVPAEIVAEAKETVKEPILRPPPAPTEEVEYEEQFADFQVPVVTNSGPFGIPQVTTQVHRTLIARVPHVRTKFPSSEALTQWREETSRRTEEYKTALQKEINTIRSRYAKELRELLESWTKIAAGGVGCLTGLVTLVVTIRKERRESLAAKRGASIS